MVQWMKALAPKPTKLSSIFWTHPVEGEKQLPTP